MCADSAFDDHEECGVGAGFLSLRGPANSGHAALGRDGLHCRNMRDNWALDNYNVLCNDWLNVP